MRRLKRRCQIAEFRVPSVMILRMLAPSVVSVNKLVVFDAEVGGTLV